MRALPSRLSPGGPVAQALTPAFAAPHLCALVGLGGQGGALPRARAQFTGSTWPSPGRGRPCPVQPGLSMAGSTPAFGLVSATRTPPCPACDVPDSAVNLAAVESWLHFALSLGHLTCAPAHFLPQLPCPLTSALRPCGRPSLLPAPWTISAPWFSMCTICVCFKVSYKLGYCWFLLLVLETVLFSACK